MISKPAFIAAVLLFVPAAALAAPQFPVSDFSRGALIGEIASTAQLQQDFNSHAGLIAQAGERLGLSGDDMATVRSRINAGEARYVVLPRHLDGMSGAKHGVAFAHYNVVIPANVHGWEVDVPKPAGTLRVFVPNRCGNVSYVMERHRILAAAPELVPAPPAPVAAAPIPAPSYEPPAQSTPEPALALSPTVPAQAASHRLYGFLPWLAAGLIGIAFSNHGGGGGTPVPPVANHPTPIPIHTICPPPVP